jgi:hypothetical protein
MISLPQLKGSCPPLQASRQQRSGNGESEQAQEQQQTKEKEAELLRALKIPLLWMKLCPNSQM